MGDFPQRVFCSFESHLGISFWHPQFSKAGHLLSLTSLTTPGSTIDFFKKCFYFQQNLKRVSQTFVRQADNSRTRRARRGQVSSGAPAEAAGRGAPRWPEAGAGAGRAGRNEPREEPGPRRPAGFCSASSSAPAGVAPPSSRARELAQASEFQITRRN